MGRARSVEVVARERAPTIEAAAIACSARQARKPARGSRRGRRATPPWPRTRAGGPGEHLRAPRRRSASASPARDLGCACWPPATLLLWVGAVKVEVAREVRARSRVHRSAPACGAKAETCADSETPEIPTETTTARRETHPRQPARAGARANVEDHLLREVPGGGCAGGVAPIKADSEPAVGRIGAAQRGGEPPARASFHHGGRP